jgi:hypothetical protein
LEKQVKQIGNSWPRAHARFVVSVFYHLPSYKNPQASGRNKHVFCAGDFEEGIAMALPKRVWFTLHEVAARWGCNIADIAGWADAGHFCIITGVTPIRSGAEIVAGKVALAPMDILPLFRRCGTGPGERSDPARPALWARGMADHH